MCIIHHVGDTKNADNTARRHTKSLSHRHTNLSKAKTIVMGRRARYVSTTSALGVVAATVALAILSCAVPAVEAKLPKHQDRNVLCEACNATLVELQAMVKKTEKKFGRGESSRFNATR